MIWWSHGWHGVIPDRADSRTSEAIMAKANSIITTVIDEANETLTITVKGIPTPIVLALADVHEDNVRYGALHGFKQRLVDNAALGRDKTTGASASPQEKWDAINQIRDHYASGSPDWNLRRGTGTSGGIVLQALARVQGTDVATITALVDRLAEKRQVERGALLQQIAKEPDVIRAIAEIRAERSPVQAGSLLAEMRGEDDDEEEGEDDTDE